MTFLGSRWHLLARPLSKPLNAPAEPDLRCMMLDLSDLQSVKEFAAAFAALNLPLHLLVNNAGIAFTDYATTKQGLEQQWGCVPKLQICFCEKLIYKSTVSLHMVSMCCNYV